MSIFVIVRGEIAMNYLLYMKFGLDDSIIYACVRGKTMSQLRFRLVRFNGVIDNF